MRDFSEVRKQIECLTKAIKDHPPYEVQQALLVNAISISAYLLGVLEGEDMAREWAKEKRDGERCD